MTRKGGHLFCKTTEGTEKKWYGSDLGKESQRFLNHFHTALHLCERFETILTRTRQSHPIAFSDLPSESFKSLARGM